VLDCESVRSRHLAIIAIVVVCLGGPIADTYDQWDLAAHDGSDTEANVIEAALCDGMVLSQVGQRADWSYAPLLGQSRVGGFDRLHLAPPAVRNAIPTCSLPIPIRI
jgi:hypothetical protein